MEANGTNNISIKSDYQKVLRPTSILFKENNICVNPETKRILNWKFPSTTEPGDDHLKSYLNFDDFNYESFDEVSADTTALGRQKNLFSCQKTWNTKICEVRRQIIKFPHEFSLLVYNKAK